MMLDKQNKESFNKTGGKCRVCGTELVFDGRSWNKFRAGNWNADHAYPRSSGGAGTVDNFLPICGICNGLKWKRKGKEVQRVIKWGIWAAEQVRGKTKLGKELLRIFNLRENRNKRRGSQRK